MEKINIKDIVKSKAPSFFSKYPKFITTPALGLLNSILHTKEMNQIIENQKGAKNLQAIEKLFDFLNFRYILSEEDKAKIPSEGRLIVVSNHPLGGLDGIALLHAVSQVRPDVKIVVNDLLLKLDPIRDMFLAYDVYSMGTQKANITSIEQTILNEYAVIFFPAAKVSRLTLHGIKDKVWNKGAVRFANKFNAPILPIYVAGKNSFFFYFASFIYDKLGMFLLPGEMLRKKNSSLSFEVGNLIPSQSITKFSNNPKIQTELLQKHLYQIGAGEDGIFATESTIIHPVERHLITEELSRSQHLGQTKDKKSIYLVDHQKAKNTLKEIARLRETTFRKVGEGTGRTHDFDSWDSFYQHIVLFDEEALEIIGSYRLGVTKEIVTKKGKNALYNSSQFDLSDKFIEKMSTGIELGRSFIQQKYWGSNALDYMWQGIGAYLQKYPDINYLWGGVSISNSYSELARSLIVSYYEKWYQGDKSLAEPKIKFKVPKKYSEEIDSILAGDDHIKDFRNLRMALKTIGYSVPVMYRRYTELCEFGGTQFIAFCVHPNFMNAVDGLMYVDLSQLKQEFRKRYYTQKSFLNKPSNS